MGWKREQHQGPRRVGVGYGGNGFGDEGAGLGDDGGGGFVWRLECYFFCRWRGFEGFSQAKKFGFRCEGQQLRAIFAATFVKTSSRRPSCIRRSGVS
jgi:hypothetical protein